MRNRIRAEPCQVTLTVEGKTSELSSVFAYLFASMLITEHFDFGVVVDAKIEGALLSGCGRSVWMDRSGRAHLLVHHLLKYLMMAFVISVFCCFLGNLSQATAPKLGPAGEALLFTQKVAEQVQNIAFGLLRPESRAYAGASGRSAADASATECVARMSCGYGRYAPQNHRRSVSPRPDAGPAPVGVPPSDASSTLTFPR